MIFNPIFHMILPVYNIQPGSRGFRIFRYIIRCHAIKRNAHILLATWGDATTYIQINCYENDKTLVNFVFTSVRAKFPSCRSYFILSN